LFVAILLHAGVNLAFSSPFVPRHGSALDTAVAEPSSRPRPPSWGRCWCGHLRA